MAFKSVKQTMTTKKASEMEVGEILQGHLVNVEASRGEFEGYNFVLRIGGEDVLVYGTGTLKYIGKDTLEGARGGLTAGFLTRITAKGKANKVAKNGKKYTISEFDVEQDDEDTIEVGGFNAIFDGEENRQTNNLASVKVATDNGIKAQAAKLAAGVASGRKA